MTGLEVALRVSTLSSNTILTALPAHMHQTTYATAWVVILTSTSPGMCFIIVSAVGLFLGKQYLTKVSRPD